MKKIYLFAAILLFAFSCTDDDVQQPQADALKDATGRYAAPPGGIRYVPDPMKLQKVVFYPGQTYQQTLNFYTSGLIKNIQDASGNITQDFFYQDGRLSLGHIYHPWETVTFTCSYDAEGYLTFGTPLFYFATGENMYVDERTWNAATEGERYYYVLKPNGLLKSVQKQTHVYEEVAAGLRWYFIYDGNDDCITYSEDSGMVSYSYDSHPNPFLPAMAPVLRGLVQYFRSSEYSSIQQARYLSQHNITVEDFDDPYVYTTVYTYNENNLPVEGIQTWMYGEMNEGDRVSVHYYYQGDVIP